MSDASVDVDPGRVRDLTLKEGKDRPVRFGHPWVFSGAIRDLDPNIPPGSEVRLLSAEGEFMARGYVNPLCTIAVRVVSRQDEPIDAELIRRRVSQALELRRQVVPRDTDAYRLINGEGDGLAGFVVDRYADVLVLQCLTAGAERLESLLINALVEALEPRAIYERSEGSVREAEGLEPSCGLLRGETGLPRVVHEHGLRVLVDPVTGQKTGYFLDQRPNRALLRDLSAGRTVLDAFTYAGGFAVHAAAGGATRVVAVDSSVPALELARRNWEMNQTPTDLELVKADVPRFLRQTDETFDIVVLDPPALVRQRRDVERGARAYKDLVMRALRRLRPGGLLLAFSCSQHVGAELFRKIAVGAAADVGRELQLLRELGAGPDHPVALAHPEGHYLSGLLLRAM